ncbi:MAG: glycosyltransferase [Nitrospinota bacterium]
MSAQDKIKVLYTTSHGNMYGGGQKSLYLLIKNLNRERFVPFLLSPENGSLIDAVNMLGVETFVLPIDTLKSLRIAKNLKTFIAIYRFMKKSNISIVHTDSPREAIYTGLAAKVLRIPFVMHLRAAEGSLVTDRILYVLSSRIIAVSRGVIRRFEWLDSEDLSKKVKLIYNGVNTSEFYNPTDSYGFKKRGGEDGFIYAGVVGRVEPLKGHDLFFKAFADIANIQSKLKGIIIGMGDKDYIKKLKRFARESGIEGRIIFKGYTDDIPSALSAIDILVVPSYTEAFSRVVIEGMAAGKPVIASDIPGNSEAVVDGMTGFLFPPGDEKPLTDILIRLIKSKKLRDMLGREGRRRARELFSIEENVKKTEKLYIETLGQS